MSVQRALTLLASRFGLRAPCSLARIETDLARLSEELGLPIGALVDRAASEPLLARRLAGALLVSESHFLRDVAQLQAAADFLLGRRSARPSAPLRVWSAGCARGEEPLSLALLLMERGGPRSLEGLEILGTDLDADVIALARAGLYRDWSLREVSAQRRAAFFTQGAAGHLRVHPTLSTKVRWAHASVQEQLALTPPRSLDLIVFRNVAIYLEAAALTAMYAGFERALDEGGWLILGLADPLPSQRFRRVEGAPHGVLVRAEPPAVAPVPTRPRTRSSGVFPAVAPLRAAGEGPSSAPPPGDDRTQAWLEEGRAAVADGRPMRAIEPLRRLLFLAPDHVLGRFWYALALSSGGESAQARAQARALTEQLETRPGDERLSGELTVAAVRSAVAPLAKGAP